MSGRDDGTRLDRVLNEGRDRVARTAAEAADRLGRAWGSVLSRTGGDDATTGGPPAPADADPSELFSAQRRREVERLGHANILVIGQTGVGKSTLINAVFRKRVAEPGTGRPVTKVIQRFDDPDVPVTLFDTKGVELGDSKNRVIRDFKREIARSRKAPPEEHIHLLWYCMDAGQTRVQDYDVDIIRSLAEDVPVVLVFTQTIDDGRADGLEAAIGAEGLPIHGGRPIRTLAEERRIGGVTIAPRGLEELVRATNDLLPEAVRRAFVNAQGIVIDLKVDRARAVVVGAGAAAAAAAAVPIPLADAVVLRPIQLGMLAGVSAVFGVSFSDEQVVELVKRAVGHGAMEKLGKRFAREIAKHVPGGNVVNAAVAASLTAALGEAYIRVCSEALRRQAAGEPLPDAEAGELLADAYDSLTTPRRGASRT